jgi:hypothetical protein
MLVNQRVTMEKKNRRKMVIWGFLHDGGTPEMDGLFDGTPIKMDDVGVPLF